MARIFALVGMAALAALAYAQYSAWSLFDNVAHDQPMRSSAGPGRAYHK